MKKISFIAFAAFLLSCNDGNEKTNDTSDAADRPRDVNEAVTNSTKIANDSVIVPDTNNTGPNPSAGVDTVGPKAKQNNDK
jgi:hypothetical protein